MIFTSFLALAVAQTNLTSLFDNADVKKGLFDLEVKQPEQPVLQPEPAVNTTVAHEDEDVQQIKQLIRELFPEQNLKLVNQTSTVEETPAGKPSTSTPVPAPEVTNTTV